MRLQLNNISMTVNYAHSPQILAGVSAAALARGFDVTTDRFYDNGTQGLKGRAVVQSNASGGSFINAVVAIAGFAAEMDGVTLFEYLERVKQNAPNGDKRVSETFKLEY